MKTLIRELQLLPRSELKPLQQRTILKTSTNQVQVLVKMARAAAAITCTQQQLSAQGHKRQSQPDRSQKRKASVSSILCLLRQRRHVVQEGTSVSEQSGCGLFRASPQWGYLRRTGILWSCLYRRR